MPKVLAIIPARSGSKRIPNKNIKDFLGKPLIAYAIEQALSLDFIDKVVVDTDSREIADVAKKYGAEIPFLRPADLAQDNSRVIDSILHLLKKLKLEKSYEPDYIMILQTTSPLCEKKDIMNCWELIQNSDADTVLTVCSTHPRLYHMKANKDIVLVNGSEAESTNMQEWKQGYILNGCFVYIINTEALLKEKVIITKKTKAVVCPKWRSVDLDTPEEWVLAELLYKNKKEIEDKINNFK